ncbi:uncharacterized protein LOC123270210 isoform X1 [Cotesia glomerata]|uniref:uncharacterized protein LOC123270210 isoform X1 n=1 Tax=Cotesia glomerata TaxID=32391 RepID=UPI001D02CE6F|nr:uncharacterized protein LOC123270210 isoform X1 [Cotesia glomerata]
MNNKLRPDLQNIIDQFLDLTAVIFQDHQVLKKSLTAREEINNSLIMASNRAQKQLDILIPQVENFLEYAKKKIKEQKTRIRLLEDEIEITQCENSLTEEKRREEIDNLTKAHESQLENLKTNYEGEIRRLQLTIESQKKSIDKLTVQAKKNSNLDHPAFQAPFKPLKKPKAKKSTVQAFNWPSLDVEVSQSIKNNEEIAVKKKRRLYTPDDENILDIDIDTLSDDS